MNTSLMFGSGSMVKLQHTHWYHQHKQLPAMQNDCEHQEDLDNLHSDDEDTLTL